MSKHNKELKDYAGMTLDEAMVWVEHNCEYEKDRRRLRSRMTGHLLLEEIKRLRLELGRPLYKHDCDKCKYLGSTIDAGTAYDLYACTEKALAGPVCIIARYSNKGPGYLSTSFQDTQTDILNFGFYLYNNQAEK